MREVFDKLAVAIWCDAVDVVARVSDRHGNEVRCHELARAALKALHDLNRRKLDEARASLTLVDGSLGSIEHSWLVYATAAPPHADFQRRFILDVYCPGRLPQVQLLDGDHFAIARGYSPTGARDDIDLVMVERLTREMQT